MQCELCKREMKSLTVHHLIPRQYIKRKKMSVNITTNICSACHKQIHSLFTNKELAEELNTIDKLQEQPQMKKFLQWVSKQNSNKRIRVRSS